MIGRLVWDRDGADWPNREASRFVEAAGISWHVQRMGQGPVLLLLHGTGASTHSWRRLAPLLASSFSVIAPDLPGHGFTDAPAPARMSLPGMADAIGQLMHALEVQPVLGVGHSAGAAILIRAAIDRRIAPAALISINGALLPFGSVTGQLFSPLAKLMVSAPFVPKLMAWRAGSRAAVERLIRGTGSDIPKEDMDIYARLFASERHVASALAMMAHWNLAGFAADLPRLKTPLVLIAGGNDAAIPPDDAFRVRDRLGKARVAYLRGLGHLAHEEHPEAVAEVIGEAASANGALAPN